MHDVSQWSEQDLLQLIENSVQEDIQLDYKSCAALQNTDRKKVEISKDVSAFANSAGGILVYGIVEEGHLPVKLDSGFDPSEITKEWLEQIINSRIQRKIDGLIIKPIELETSNPGKVAFVVSIPQSTRAPHQAYDKRFYKRYNFESVPMEEYEIRDVSHRSDGPLLSMSFYIEKTEIITQNNGEDKKEIKRIHLMPLIENDSPVPAEYIAMHLYIDKSVQNLSRTGEFKKQDDIYLFYEGEVKQYHSLNANHAIPSKIPIFKGSKFRLLQSPLLIDIENDGEYYLAYTLLAPYMNEKSNSAIIKVENMNAEIK